MTSGAAAGAIPGRPTYDALEELSRFHPEQYPKDRMLVLAERRAGADAEQAPWRPDEVVEFAEEAERTPRAQADLFRIALSRLDDLKLNWEEGDESEARLVARVANEVELRLAVAHRLREAAAGRYTPTSEEELADKKRTDIRLHSPAVEARLPIEIKIAGQWAAAEMRERLENQLVKQYMREAKYGVFLVVNRGGKKDRKQWTVDGKLVGFGRVVAWLQEEARGLASRAPSIDGLEVVGIDLTRRIAVTRTKAATRKGAGHQKVQHARAPAVRGRKGTVAGRTRRPTT